MSAVATDDSQAIAMLCAPLAVGDVKPLTIGEWTSFAHAVGSSDLGRPSALFGLSAEEIAKCLSVDPPVAERLQRLLRRGGPLAFERERLHTRGIWLITTVDESYPQRLRERLGDKAPPVLFGAGSPGNLALGGVAIVGSRDASAAALEFTEVLARQLAGEGAAIVSGAARGVDQVAMAVAMDSGGVAVGVLADNLLQATQQGDTRELLEVERLTLVSPYAPSGRFSVGNAMGRNKLIYCLADAAVVASTSVGSGGTWAGAVEDLKRQWIPLWAWADEEAPPGNEALLREGAEPLVYARLPKEDVATFLSRRGESLGSAAAAPEAGADLFNIVWPELAKFLTVLRSEQEVADRFSLERTQARAWLHRAADEGLCTRKAKPVRYRVSLDADPGDQPALFDTG